MSVAAAQAAAFYEESAKEGRVFTFLDDDSFLVFRIDNKDVVPFWSSRSRMEKIKNEKEKYKAFAFSELPLNDFLERTLAQFEEENIHIGVNWSGTRLTGYDITTVELRRNMEYWLKKLDKQ